MTAPLSTGAAACRPLEPDDRPALEALVASYPMGRPVDLGPWFAAPSGRDQHLWISAGGAARLAPNVRSRARHMAALEVVGVDPAPLATAVDFADRWIPLDRLELALPADHPLCDEAGALGFEPEVRRAQRLVDGRDEVLFGRLRPGFVARPTPPPPVWPAPRRRAAPDWRWTPVTVQDSEAMRALSVAPSSLFGTLQTPSSSVAFYADRALRTAVDDEIGFMRATDDPAEPVLGVGGIHPSGVPGVCILGIALAEAWQGCGLGPVLMAHLLERARSRGYQRAELSVYDDNERAVALYRRLGFVVEGRRRCDAVRDGGHASSLDMALRL